MLVALALKYHYSRSGSDALIWMLTPTAEVVEQVSGVRFTWEHHTGFVSQDRRVIIAPSCAGINFMLMAFGMAVFSGIGYFSNKRDKGFWLAGCLAGSYLLTIAVNAGRIIVSMLLYDADIYTAWLTPQRIHRLTGTLIYFLALRLFYILIIWVLSRRTDGYADSPIIGISNRKIAEKWGYWSDIGLVPLFWYGLFALGIPLLHTAGGLSHTLLMEHSWMVISGCLLVILFVFLIHSGIRRMKQNGSARCRNKVKPDG